MVPLAVTTPVFSEDTLPGNRFMLCNNITGRLKTTTKRSTKGERMGYSLLLLGRVRPPQKSTGRTYTVSGFSGPCIIRYSLYKIVSLFHVAVYAHQAIIVNVVLLTLFLGYAEVRELFLVRLHG